MEKKIIIGAIFSILAVGLAALFSLQAENPEESYKLPVRTVWCVEFKKADSKDWENLGCVHNVLTNGGKEHIEGILGGTITSNLHTKYIALGNGSAPASTSTSLDGEQTGCGLARTLGNYYDLGTGNWEINTTFTYTCSGTLTVNTTAAFNQASGGTLFAGGVITPVTFSTNGDQLRIRHIYTVSEG